MTRVVVLDDYQGRADELGDWSRLGDDVEIDYLHRHLDEDALVSALRGAEIVVAMRERTAFPRQLLERLPELRLLVSTGLANAAIDIGAADDLGITVSGTHSGPDSTMELTWALLLALIKQVSHEDAAMRRGAWQERLAGDLAGTTLGLIGLGRIGAAMVPVARAFQMDVVAWSQNLTDERATEAGAKKVDKLELLGVSDVVSIHLRLSERTRGLIGRAELAAMRPEAVLVNTSRGPIVDEAALLEALSEHRIAGAALDVYDAEPLPADHPLLALDNTVLTPHLGYASVGNFRLYYAEVIEDIEGYLAGAPVRVLSPG